MKKQVLAGVAALTLAWCATSRADENVKITQGPPSAVLSTPAPQASQPPDCHCHNGQYLLQAPIVVEPNIVYPANPGYRHDGKHHNRDDAPRHPSTPGHNPQHRGPG